MAKSTSGSPAFSKPSGIVRPLVGLYLLLGATTTVMAGPGGPGGPKQGLVDMLIEYLSAKYIGVDLGDDVLYVSVQRQTLFHIQAGQLMASYPISTAAAGLGIRQDSYRTPLGLHRIAACFGSEVPVGGVFEERVFTGQVADSSDIGRDLITSRILWLEGAEPGVNVGPGIDSMQRKIYIHGTTDSQALGRPASKGCIRMSDLDVIELFDRVAAGTAVVILDN
ncbi:MAG: L,D-transpeptidase [Flavobacteriales bacterium]|nr:L,D-transpeptidase [Flavobacteriales bacterium]